MTQFASLLLTLGLRLLPAQERRRYSEELETDLVSQPVLSRLPYAVSTLLGMPRLRWELLQRLAGQPVPFCFVGMHRDLTVHTESDDPRIVAKTCILCHRTRDPRQYLGRTHPEGLSWVASRQGQ